MVGRTNRRCRMLLTIRNVFPAVLDEESELYNRFRCRNSIVGWYINRDPIELIVDVKLKGGDVKYRDGDRNIRLGDSVLVENGIGGLVVCDFEGKEYEPGYEDWSAGFCAAASGIPVKGIMVSTAEYGLIYYESEDDSIVFVKSKQ